MADNSFKLPIFFNKSLATNVIAAGMVVAGLLLPEPARTPVLSIGLFALSGAITNWLAIYMLFEKVPYVYGSGVVPARFEDFKRGIHSLVMDQFFSKKNVENFFKNTENNGAAFKLDVEPILDGMDISPAFDELVAVVMSSSLGGMLAMIGGQSALESLREPFMDKMMIALKKITKSQTFNDSLSKMLSADSPIADEIIEKVDRIVQNRLNELTPEMVKEIVQKMIRAHLGWLVVWGGVFGGFIGLLTMKL